MEALLDFSKPQDVQLFEKVVQSLHNATNNAAISQAQDILTQYREHPESYSRVVPVLQESQCGTTKFFALQVLDQAISSRWNTFDGEQQLQIRNFIVGLIVTQCSNTAVMREQKAYSNKLNSTLINIAKRMWPLRWPTFVQEVVQSASFGEGMTENTLNLLRILSEEVFECGERTMTSRWIERKKKAMERDFSLIFNFCIEVIQQYGESNTQLMNTALRTLEKFVLWTPYEFLFVEDLLAFLSSKAVQNYSTRVAALRVLTEIGQLEVVAGPIGDRQKNLIVSVFRTTAQTFINELPTSHEHPGERCKELCVKLNETEMADVFLLFLVGVLKNHMRSLLHDEVLMEAAHQCIIGMSHVPSKEMFRTCMEYFWFLGDYILKNRKTHALQVHPLEKSLRYVLPDVRTAIIKQMARPDEVLIATDENGDLVSEKLEDVESIQLHKTMREALIFFTNIDPHGTKKIMTALIARQADRSEWSWANLSSLSWAIGSVSGALSRGLEEEVFVTIMKELLDMCKHMEGKENRAVIASNIMYIVGQYPLFLRSHLGFLRTVVRKLFEFMHEPFPGIKDMSCDTFNKLCTTVGTALCLFSTTDLFPFEILKDLVMITIDLNQVQVQKFFGAMAALTPDINVGVKMQMVANKAMSEHAPLPVECRRDGQFLAALLADVNTSLEDLVTRGKNNFSDICNSDDLRLMINVLRVNVAVAKHSGSIFLNQFDMIFFSVQWVYSMFSEAMKSEIQMKGDQVASHQHMRLMKTIKKEVILVIENFIANTEECEFVSQNCISPILDSVLTDYANSLPLLRLPAALSVVTACVSKLGSLMSPHIAPVLNTVFDTTVQMISVDMESFPEIRINLFKMLQGMNESCFEAFVDYVQSKSDVVNGILWAVKHSETEMMITGLVTLHTFLLKMMETPMAATFFEVYYTKIMTEILVATLDKLHAAGFNYHVKILMILFSLTSRCDVSCPIFGYNAVFQFLKESMKVVESLTEEQIRDFATQGVERSGSEAALKTLLADFLIESRVWGSAEENRLIRDEEEAERAQNVQGYVQASGGYPQDPQQLKNNDSMSVSNGSMSMM